MLHKGSPRDKMIDMLVSNGFAELRRHKTTMRFIELFHNCFKGEMPYFAKRWFVSSVYKPVYDEARKIAEARIHDADNMGEAINQSIMSMHTILSHILTERIQKKIEGLNETGDWDSIFSDEFLSQFEIPSELRSFFEKTRHSSRLNSPDIPDLLDGLSFPFLTSTLILAAYFTSTRVLYNARPLLTEFSEKINQFKQPKRALWLTDTFEDHNGVSIVLQSFYKEIVERDLPIDIMVCSNKLKSDDHLVVLKPVAEFDLPVYQEQPIRVPNFLEVHKKFHDGEYDRIICSTEGVMGLVSLFLKNAYHVPAHFYIHTDWITFGKKVLKLKKNNLNRLRRILRAFYHNFDSLFVLNTDQHKWLTNRKMGFKDDDVHLTAHWVEEDFIPHDSSKEEQFDLAENEPVLLFTGRVSHEKGVMELPSILTKARQEIPDLKLVVAGTGPAEEELRKAIPDATYLGWVDHKQLPQIYAAADLLILPSKFDTFSCVVLESFSCGLPVIAYNTKGPKDIIQHGKNGYLANSKTEIANSIIEYFSDNSTRKSFKKAAKKRAGHYAVDQILSKFLHDIDLEQPISEYEPA
ncbi:MAG: glycosyltransferase, partial [Calditrichaeota bacterium]|nr:glycosyltransferase [Calditrichota bacterium]